MWIVFTDLDGTLLDFENYSYEPALDAIRWLQREQIPIIIITSKTYEEVKKIWTELNIADPFVVENGACVFIKVGYRGWKLDWPERDDFKFKILGCRVDELRRMKEELMKRYKLIFLSDMDTIDIVKLTGLSLEDAKRAKKREFSEPFLLLNGTEDEIEEFVRSRGYKLIRGRRFHHLMCDVDKGYAVRLLKELYLAYEDGTLKTIGIGDSFNDIPIFENVDYPVLLGVDKGRFADIKLPGLIRLNEPGPQGWKNGIFKILKFRNSKI